MTKIKTTVTKTETTMTKIKTTVQMASGTSQEYFFRRGQRDPNFDNIVRDFAQGFELALCNRTDVPNVFRKTEKRPSNTVSAWMTSFKGWFPVN